MRHSPVSLPRVLKVRCEFGEFLVPALMTGPWWELRRCSITSRVFRSGRSLCPCSFIYSAARRMCALAIGIGKGLARHFYEEMLVTQPVCMHNRADHCEILFPRDAHRGDA